jgi:hypothetical protein
MVKFKLVLIVAITAGLTACCDNYVFLRIDAQQAVECDVKNITEGDDGASLRRGSIGYIERRADTVKGTAIRFEVTCGADVKRYTLYPTCTVICDRCRGDNFEGEITYVSITPRGFLAFRSDCVLGANLRAPILDNGGYLTPDD